MESVSDAGGRPPSVFAAWPRSRAAGLGATIAAGLFVIGLYAVVAFQSPGYDDEYLNIGVVEGGTGYTGILVYAAANDFHPPGQYLLNKILFDLLGDWSWVRMAQATFVSTSIVAVWLAVRTRERFQPAFAWLTICLNPALLMWCTGLRWYGPFAALLNLLLLILIKPPRRPIVYWGALTGGLLALLYVGYLTLILAPVVLGVGLRQRRATLTRELPVLGSLLLVAGTLALPQLFIFFSVHLKNAEVQTSDVITSLGTLAVHFASGPAAMPLSTFGLALAAANIGVCVIAVRYWRSILPQPATLLLTGGGLAMLAARLAGKLHTLVTLSTLQGIVQTAAYGRTSSGLSRGLLMVLFAVGNIGGIVNVASHSNTTKGGWNTPYAKVLETFQARTATCAGTLALTHDPVLTYRLRRLAGVTVVFDAEGLRERMAAQGSDCVAVFETFRGGMRSEQWRQYATSVATLSGRSSVDRLGPDPSAAFKRYFDPDVPDNYVTMTIFRK